MMRAAAARLLAMFLGALLIAVQGASASPADAPAVRLLDRGWQVRLAPGDANARTHPRASRWLPASVPGTVQTDLIAARLLADPWRGEGERAAQWVGLSDWQYRLVIDVDAATMARPQVDLVFEGLDTLATVRINGAKALSADNMFRSWRIAAKPMLRAGRNVIDVEIASPIKALLPMVLALRTPLPGSYDSAFGDEPKGRQTANYVRKPGYHYGWDWAPRIVTAGIWQAVRLEAHDGVRLSDLYVQQQHLDDSVATLDARVEIASDAARTVDVQVTVKAPEGAVQTLDRRVTLFAGRNVVALPVRIDRPRRWWPVGYGRPDLYDVTATLSEEGRSIGRATHAIGLRTVELRRDADRWGRGMAFVVNGVPIFAKGANMVPFDSIPSRTPAARADAVLEAAVEANMNMLRIWGGGYYLGDVVYAKADRLGLMLWQDFMFGGAVPPNDPAFHANVRQEAEEQVRRLRNHPSLVIWVGNNEVQTGWENWSDRKAFKAAMTPDEQEVFGASIRRLFDKDLRAAVALHSPGTPYFGGSPTTDYDGPAEQMTDGDVHYWSVWTGAPLEEYLTVTPRFMSEFGLQSMPGMRTTRAFMAPRRPEDLPVQLADSGYDRGAGNGRILGYLRTNYGEPRSFPDYVYLSQLLQAEGLEMAVLHLRASRPQAMGTLYWTMNDAWPGQINSLWAGQAWGSIDFHNRWKASHHRARRFYAPLTIAAQRSAGITKVTLVSDRQAPLDATWRVRVMDRDGAVLSDRTGTARVPALAAMQVAQFADADLLGSADPARTFAVAELIAGGARVARQFVYFAHAKDLALTDPAIEARIVPDGAGYRLTLKAGALARGVWIDFGDVDAALSDNAFDLAPGETIDLALTASAPIAALRRALSVRSLFGATTGTKRP